MYTNPYAPARWNPTNIEVHEEAPRAIESAPMAPPAGGSGNAARMVVGGLIVAGGIGGLAWWLVKRQKAAAAAAAAAAQPSLQDTTHTQSVQALTQEPSVLQWVPPERAGAQELAPQDGAHFGGMQFGAPTDEPAAATLGEPPVAPTLPPPGEPPPSPPTRAGIGSNILGREPQLLDLTQQTQLASLPLLITTSSGAVAVPRRYTRPVGLTTRFGTR